VPRDQPDTGAIAPRHDAKAVMLDFVNPAWPGRRGLRWRRQTRFDNSQPRAGTLTQRHSEADIEPPPLQRKILREAETPAGGGSSDRGRAGDRPKDLGSPVRPSPMLIKPAISGARMGHLGRWPGNDVLLTVEARNAPVARLLLGKSAKLRGPDMNRSLIVAISLICAAPLYAQDQQQNVTKLKADARNLVGIIGSDKTKTQTYCQIDDLSEQLDQAIQKKERKKAKTLAEKIAELNKEMGPEFAALVDIEKHVDLNSLDGQEIASIVASLGESCGVE
jgi:hypothetical protein